MTWTPPPRGASRGWQHPLAPLALTIVAAAVFSYLEATLGDFALPTRVLRVTCKEGKRHNLIPGV